MPKNESAAVVEQWRRGVPLSEAWLTFAEPYSVRKLRETSTRGAFNAQRIMMVADLWAGLKSGEWLAFGKSVKPIVSSGPILIPTHTFEFRPPVDTGETDDFEISGWRYESVTVAPNDGGYASEAGPNDAPPRQKRGPKPIAPLIVAAIESLRCDDPLFDRRGQDKRIEAIRERVAIQNPALYPGRHRPGHTTVWNYLTGRKPLK